MTTRARAHGQAIVEVAMIVTLLLILLMGIFDVAMALNTRLALHSAVAEAGYYAAQSRGDDAGIRARVRGELSWLTPAIANGQIGITRSGCSGSTPAARITVSYTFTPTFLAIGPLAEVDLGSETTVPLLGGC